MIELKNVKNVKNNTLEKPNVAFANDSLNTGKLQIILITPALQQQYQRISTSLRTPSRTCMLLIPLELQVTNNPSRRKAREAYYIQRGQTLTPYGINRRNKR